MRSSGQLRINLLGHLRLTVENQPIVSLQTDRYQSLLAYLILKARVPQPRSHIASLFWSDTSESQAKANLRRAIYRLRKALPDADQFLQVTTKTIQWLPQAPFWLDVAEFEVKISQATLLEENQSAQVQTLKQAVELYQEGLLPTCYDDWIEPERKRLHQLMVSGLSDLGRLLAELKDYRGAIAFTQQLLQLEPLSESGYLRLMQLHVQQGERALALQVYHQCMTLLREEMGIDPSAQTRQFYEQMLLDEFPNPGSSSHQSGMELGTASPATVQFDWGEAPELRFFYGRSEESRQLHQWMGPDRCSLVAVLGMGGIGKTFLAAKVANELQGEFDLIIWRSLRNAPPLETLLVDLIPFLSRQQDSSYSLTRLIYWLRQSRCLIILDNLDTIFKGGERAGQCRDGYENYSELFVVVGQASHQSCLLLTSREKPLEVATFADTNPAVRALQLEGSPETALALINAKQLVGTKAEKKQLCQRYSYSPLSLQIISSSIRDFFAGEISLFLAEDSLLFNGVKRLLDNQFERLTALEKTVMIWLGINRDWTNLPELKADIYPSSSKMKLIETLESLCWRSLIERRGNSYTQQPVIMEYVTDRLIEQIFDELVNPDCFEDNANRADAIASYALIKTTVKDFVRESQERLILHPIAEQLRQSLSAPEQSILHHLETLKSLEPKPSGYGAGNLINLGWALEMDFTGLDLSQLTICQGYLQHLSLHQVNFARAVFKDTAFNQPLGPVFSLAYSADGSLLATGEGGGRIIVWRMADQKPILTLKESTNWIMALDFSRDGKRLVSEGSNNRLNIWDLARGKCIKSLNGHRGVIWAIDASPQENIFVSGGVDAIAIVWDWLTGEPLARLIGHRQKINSLAFSPDGKLIASASGDKTLRIWSTQTGKALKNWQCEAEPLSVSFSPDGQQLAVGQNDGQIRLWRIQVEQIEMTLQAHEHWVLSVAFSPCGGYLASGSADLTTKLWDVTTGQLLRTAAVYSSWTWSLAFSPDGQYLAVGNNDHTIRLWQLPKKELFKLLQGYASWVTSVKFHPSQPLLVSGSDDFQVRLWNWETGALIKTLAEHSDWVLGVSLSPCGQKIASSSSDRTIKLWGIETGQLLKTFLGHESSVWCLEFSPNSQQLLSGSFDRTVRLWDVSTGQLTKTIKAHEGWIFSARFSPEGNCFATTGVDGVIKLWDTETGELLIAWQGQQSSTWMLGFSPDGQQLVTGGEDATVKVWNPTTGELLQTLEGHNSSIWAVEFSPDGKILASGGDDCTIKIWDINTSQLLQTLDEHQGRVNALSFTADSQMLASGSTDETICLWDLASGECLMTLRAPRPYEGMNISEVRGLTEAQKESLKVLGAIEN